MNSQQRARQPDFGSLDRGTFRDEYRSYTVRASSVDAPDSFQVITGAQGDDVVLVVSGLNSGALKATWGRFWRGLKPQTKIWIEEQAFRAFYSGHHIFDPAPGTVRFCDG
ncbi:hypothetical protein [Glycomyces harbinensis]|uniref:Uncharacterized protein n=1 Tax=Glycomyces harbinensis TaxID=58114 RepID=A0A1G6X990_9ACTN|nr:hypothetical protein [Glycomyces harbinensis]SDD74682.1 hypothetical protein SAMN05216270_10741 [Glycomyces harbinensis]